MESGKSPGTDGLPVEFYKVLWKDVSTFLISSPKLFMRMKIVRSLKITAKAISVIHCNLFSSDFFKKNHLKPDFSTVT